MLPSRIRIWQPELTDKILSRKTGAVQTKMGNVLFATKPLHLRADGLFTILFDELMEEATKVPILLWFIQIAISKSMPIP